MKGNRNESDLWIVAVVSLLLAVMATAIILTHPRREGGWSPSDPITPLIGQGRLSAAVEFVKTGSFKRNGLHFTVSPAFVSVTTVDTNIVEDFDKP